MSSALVTLVPILDGSNHLAWSSMMQNYLMSYGQWYTITTGAAPSPTGADLTAPDNQSAINSWNDDNTRAIGNMRLRLSPAIQSKYRDESNAKALWDDLVKSYGQPGIAAVYSEFKSAIEMQIPSNSHPAPALDKLCAHFDRLEANKASVPKEIQAMILLAKLPTAMDSIAQIVNQKVDLNDLDFDEIRRMIILSWEQRSGRRNTSSHSNANKISAIKRKQPDPQFRQQHQQQRQNDGSSSGQCGHG